MFILAVEFNILDQRNGARGGITVAIAGNTNEIYLVGNCDSTGQVGQKNKGAVEDACQNKIFAAIVCTDLCSQRINFFVNLFFC